MNKIALVIIIIIISIVDSFAQVTIQMDKRGNVYYIPGKVNGLDLEFIFDTGASNVCLSMTEALFMLKNGKLDMQDVKGTSYSSIADGSIVENTNVILREIEVGGITLTNVEAVVVQNLDAPLLFGQSAIQKLGPIQLDGNTLVISNGKNLPSNENAFSLYQKSYQESEAGNYDNAIKLSEQALSQCSDIKLRAMLYDNIAYAYYHSNRKEEAIASLNAALGEDLMCEQPAYNLGVYYFEMGEVAKALRALNIFVERHKDTQNIDILAAAYAYKGDCHSKNGEIKDAENAYKKSLSLMPNIQPMLGLADLYLNIGRYSDAIPHYKSALEYEPNRMSNIKRHHQLGFCYARLNMNSESLNAFRNCLAALGANHELIDFAMKSGEEDMQNTAIFNLHLGFTAQLWVARLCNNPSETITNYEQIFEIPGLSDEFLYQDFLNWASAYTANGENPRSIAKALEVLRKGLIVLPDNPEILFYCALYTDSNSTEHLDYLMRILNQEYTYKPISFDYGTVYNNIAWHYCLNKQYTIGLTYAQTAIKQNPEHAYSWETLGELYFNMGQYQDCVNAMTKVLNCKNSEHMFKSAYEFRGNALMKLGRKKEAKADLDKAKTL